MGPAVLVTLGLLFLLANRSNYPFQRTWPILLIVIGAVKLVRTLLPDREHLNPGQYQPPYAGQAPPPPEAGASDNSNAEAGNAGNNEVRNG
jgi:hypothetical protein